MQQLGENNHIGFFQFCGTINKAKREEVLIPVKKEIKNGEVGADLSFSFLQFACAIREDSFNRLLVRDCYTKIFVTILHQFFVIGKRGVVLTGTPGIGKSFFGAFFLFNYFQKEGRLDDKSDDPWALVHQVGIYVVLFIPRGFDVSPLLHCLGMTSGLVAGNVYSLMISENIKHLLLANENLIYIFDPNGQPVSSSYEKCKILLISSPSDIYKNFVKQAQGQVVKMYMPIWSIAELRMAKISTFDKPRLLSIEESKKLSDAHYKYGGSARNVFSSDEEAISKSLEEAFVTVAPFDLKTLITAEVKGPTMSAMLFHRNVKLDDYFAVPRFQFASKYVKDQLLKKYQLNSKKEFLQWMQEGKGKADLQSLRGIWFEPEAHFNFREGVVCELLPVGSINTPLVGSKSKRITLPKLDHVTFGGDARNIEDIKWKVNMYAQPIVDNYPSLDSFAVLPTSLFDGKAKKEDLAIVGFQVTVADHHDIVGNDLVKLHDLAKEKLKKPNIPFYLVFATDNYDFIEAQKPIIKNELEEVTEKLEEELNISGNQKKAKLESIEKSRKRPQPLLSTAKTDLIRGQSLGYQQFVLYLDLGNPFADKTNTKKE